MIKKAIILKILIFLFLFSNYLFPVELQLTGSLSEMYDDNIHAIEEKESDFITGISAGLGLIHEGRTLNWHLLGESTQQFYYKNNDLNNNSQSAELAISKEIFYGDSISIIDTFVHSHEVNTFQDIFGQSIARSEYYHNTFTSIYTNHLLRFFYITLEYQNIYTNTVTEESEDSISNRGSIITAYEINSFNNISVFYSYTHRKNLGDVEAENNETILQEYALGYQHLFNRRLSGNLQGGFEHVTTEDETNYNFFGTASLTHQINENNTILFSVSRQYEIAPLTNQVYNIWNLTADFTRELTRVTSFSLLCFYQYGYNVSSTTTQKNKLFGLETELTYHYSEHISSSISYRYTYSHTEQTEPEDYYLKYNRNQVQIALNAEF